MSAGFPGYTGRLLPKDRTIAEHMRARGYSTYMLGKWHLTPDDEATDLGPFDRWPTGKGFDHWLGFLGGAVDQDKPPLVEDNLRLFGSDRAFFYAAASGADAAGGGAPATTPRPELASRRVRRRGA